MSADNGIYILQTLDGFRVKHTQAIDNLYWWEGETRNEINPDTLKECFGLCDVLKTKEEALMKASKMEEEIANSSCPILEYGIQMIHGWENKVFPNSEEDDLCKKYPFVDINVIEGLESENELKELDCEYTLVLSSDDNEWCATGFRNSKVLGHAILEHFESGGNEGWWIHSVYHNQKPIKFKKTIKIQLIEE